MTDKAISYPDELPADIVAEAREVFDEIRWFASTANKVNCIAQSLMRERSRHDPGLTAEVERLKEAHQRIVNLDEAMGHNVTVADAYHAIAISRAALGEA